MFKKNHIFFILIVLTALFGAQSAFAEEEADHTAREVAEGQAIFEKLQSKELTCEKLKDDDLAALGEYFMGQMVGREAHPAMNNMITAMHGEEGEKQMHIVMGARLSGCDLRIPLDSKFSGFMPMMGMMGGGMTGNWSYPSSINNNNKFFPMMYGFGNNMMSWAGAGLTFGIVGVILMVLWWLFVVAAIVFLIKWIAKQFKGESSGEVLEILKKRYARGEIDKNEFEEKKKELL